MQASLFPLAQAFPYFYLSTAPRTEGTRTSEPGNTLLRFLDYVGASIRPNQGMLLHFAGRDGKRETSSGKHGVRLQGRPPGEATVAAQQDAAPSHESSTTDEVVAAMEGSPHQLISNTTQAGRGRAPPMRNDRY